MRELQYIIEKTVILSEKDIISADDLAFSSIENHLPKTEALSSNLDEVEKNTILKVLEKNNGNVTSSAKELGITRTALYRRMNKHGI